MTALEKEYPGVAKKREAPLLLEDNDPSGYKTKLGEAAKARNKIKVPKIPKRSPDLNVMDYNV